VSALRSRNHLNHLFRIAKPILYAFRVGAEGLRGELRRHARFGKRRILSDKPNLVHAYA
jgi:hypothetical protein